jgi:hypothetical protein
MRAGRWILAMSLMIGLAGCCSCPKSKPYYGPTETMSQVVAEINANNQQLGTLWARHNFTVSGFDDSGRKFSGDGEGTLQYRGPVDLRLAGRHPVLGDLFDLGSNGDEFWFISTPPKDPGTMWWGHYANLGKPCMKPMPVQPDLLLEVLGIGGINTNFREFPAPTMRFNNDDDSYMLTWVAPLQDRLVVQKEIWYDRQTKLPKLVNLFDDNGRIVLRAYLSDHVTVAVDNLAKEKWPKVATRYDLYFPETKTKLTLKLHDVVLEHNGFPKDFSFQRPAHPDVAEDIQVDADCN